MALWMCFGADPLYTALTDEEISQGVEFTYSADTMTMYNIYGLNGDFKYTYMIDYLTNLNQECLQFTGEKCEGIDGMIDGMEAWDSAWWDDVDCAHSMNLVAQPQFYTTKPYLTCQLEPHTSWN